MMRLKSSSQIVLLWTFCCLVLASPCVLALSRETKPTDNGTSYLFFPYRSCLLLTVSKVYEAPFYGDKCVRLEARIDDVLRGRFKKGEQLKLRIDKKLADLDLGGSLAGGTKLVLAFNDLWGSEMWTYNTYSPFHNGEFTTADVETLKTHLQRGVYPYRACLLVTIMGFRAKQSKEHNLGSIVTMRIEEVLLDDRMTSGNQSWYQYVDYRFAKGRVLRAIIEQGAPKDIFPRPGTKLLGSRCIWAFDPETTVESTPLMLTNMFAPFPYQQYKPSDVQRLRSDLKTNFQRVRSLYKSVQTSFEQRWTPERLKEYCRPETRMVAGSQCLNGFGSVLSGELYRSRSKEFGKIRWYLYLNRGEPDACEIDVDRGNAGCWRLPQGYLTLAPFSEDDLKLSIAGSILWSSGLAYSKVTLKTLGAESRDFEIPREIERIVRDDNGVITAIEYKLRSQKLLTANIDERANVKSVLIDGKVDPWWQAVLSDANKNLEALWHE